jgi:hypothetical protein
MPQVFHGDDPFQPLTFFEVFLRSAQVYRAAPATFVGLGLIGVLPSLLIGWLILSTYAGLLPTGGGMKNNGYNDDDQTGLNPDELDDMVLATLRNFYRLLFLALVAMVVFGTIIKVATIRSTVRIFVSAAQHHRKQQEQEEAKDQPPPAAGGLAEDLYHGVKLLPRMFGLQLLFSCTAFCTMLTVGFASLIIAFILSTMSDSAASLLYTLVQIAMNVVYGYVVYTTILWDIALVVEGLPGLQPFFRSYDLVRRQCCFVFCAIFLESVVLMAITLINVLLVGTLLGSYWAAAIAQALFGVVFVPYTAIFLTVLYINARVVKAAVGDDVELFDGNILARDMKLTDEEAGDVEASFIFAEARLKVQEYTDDVQKTKSDDASFGHKVV